MSTHTLDPNASSEHALIKAATQHMQTDTLNVTKTDAITQPLIAKTSELRLSETNAILTDSDYKPKSDPHPTIATKDQLSLPLLRFPLKSLNTPQVSSLLPTTQNLFEVVYFMDCLISEDNNFQNTGFLWHPFLSNIYFGLLVYILVMEWCSTPNKAHDKLVNRLNNSCENTPLKDFRYLDHSCRSTKAYVHHSQLSPNMD